MQFYRTEPTPRTSWRLAVLMGANTRTYKFALAHALLEAAARGADKVSLDDLARPYALALAQRVLHYPQARADQSRSEQDFLSVCAAEAEATLLTGDPTPALLESARRSMPAMVMQKFHNLRGGTQLPHRFYEVGTGVDKGTVMLAPELRAVAQDLQVSLLEQELEARWAIVEASFSTGIGPVLRSQGLRVDGEGMVEAVRRVPVTGVREAISGFQHGRCSYCHDPLDKLNDEVAVDHVYPFSLMQRESWQGPNLNEVWNLVLAHTTCNGSKSNRLPTEAEVQRLLSRNEAIIESPHPLRRALETLMTGSPGTFGSSQAARLTFLHSVDASARWA